MPIRKVPLITNEIYHVVNRGNASLPIFKGKRDYSRFVQTVLYYQFSSPPTKLSQLPNIPQPERAKIIHELEKKSETLVEIIAYCLMPNHFHFILKQLKDGGILNFTRLSCNSYSRYFNTKHQRKGSLFEGRFKAIRIETDSQLLHLSRYVHLNPYSSFVTKTVEETTHYPYSSLPEYLGISKEKTCYKEAILNFFSGIKDYERFVLDRADYQRGLEIIKHQLLET